MSGYLELADGGLMAVRDGLLLGRVAGCDIVVDDKKASRRHARIIVESGVVEIEDLGSSNGTLLNGNPVERRMLRDGDEVRIGATAIVYREGAMPVAGGSAPRSAPAARALDDDDDLLGGGNDLLGGDEDLLGGDDLSAAAPAPRAPEPVRPPPPPAAGNVVEFEDEVVEVAKPTPKPKPQPQPTPTPAPPSPRASDPVVEVRKAPAAAPGTKPAKAAGSGGGDVVAASGRILQYSKKAGGANPLGDDLAQMSSGMRLLVVLVVLALGGAIVWGVMHAMQ